MARQAKYFPPCLSYAAGICETTCSFVTRLTVSGGFSFPQFWESLCAPRPARKCPALPPPLSHGKRCLPCPRLYTAETFKRLVEETCHRFSITGVLFRKMDADSHENILKAKEGTSLGFVSGRSLCWIQRNGMLIRLARIFFHCNMNS
jgi:hypothetical protein